MEGRKDDADKLRWDLLPFNSVEKVVKVLQYGANKYGDFNWFYVKDYKRRYFSACMRHLIAWWKGEKYDKESGYNHLAHAICCLIFLLEKDDCC